MGALFLFINFESQVCFPQIWFCCCGTLYCGKIYGVDKFASGIEQANTGPPDNMGNIVTFQKTENNEFANICKCVDEKLLMTNTGPLDSRLEGQNLT